MKRTKNGNTCWDCTGQAAPNGGMMMTAAKRADTVDTQPRVAAGTPGRGGEWDFKTYQESDETLTLSDRLPEEDCRSLDGFEPVSVSRVFSHSICAHCERPITTAVTVKNHATGELMKIGINCAEEAGMDTEDMIANVMMHHAGPISKKYADNFDLDADDLGQEAILRYLMSRRSGNLVDSPVGFLHSAARSIAVRSISGQNRVRQSVLEYRQACYDKMQSEGRSLTAAEEDVIAHEVRERRPKSDRPPVDFHRTPVGRQAESASLDVIEEGGGAACVSDMGIPGAEVEYMDEAPGSIVDKVLSASEAKRKVELRRLAWDAIASLHSAPNVANETLTETQATASRRAVTASGGVVAMAVEWDSGRGNSDALFAPFGNLTTDEKDKVTDILLRHPSKADDLWGWALTEATVARKSSNRKK